MPSSFTRRAKGEMALTESNRKEWEGRGKCLPVLGKAKWSSVLPVYILPGVVRFLGERCSPTMADSEHLCYLPKRQDQGFSISQGLIYPWRLPCLQNAPTIHRLLWKKSPTPRNYKEKEVEATVKEQVHLRKLPHQFRENWPIRRCASQMSLMFGSR